MNFITLFATCASAVGLTDLADARFFKLDSLVPRLRLVFCLVNTPACVFVWVFSNFYVGFGLVCTGFGNAFRLLLVFFIGMYIFSFHFSFPVCPPMVPTYRVSVYLPPFFFFAVCVLFL